MKRGHLNPSQQGFALIAAIVLIVVLAAMAGFVASMVGGQSAGQQLERMSGVADMAAQTGVEWGAYQVLRQPVAACAPSTLLPPLPGSLGAATVRVTCTSAVTTEPLVPGPGTVTIYRITATAIAGANPVSPDYVERTKTAVFSR